MAEKMMEYEQLRTALEAVLVGERALLPNMANFTAFIYRNVPRLSWCGFYLLQRDGSLVLGPFQGKPAVARIAPGNGVCGAAIAQGKTLIVNDVEQFPGHIVCDPDSRSEIVIPFFHASRLLAVFDVDAPVLNRFTERDQTGLEALLQVLAEAGDCAELLPGWNAE